MQATKDNSAVFTMQPMKKAPLKTIGTDAMLAASTLVNEVMARIKVDAKPWNGYAQRVVLLTTDGRTAFLDLMAKEKKAMIAANAAVTASVGKDGKPAVTKDDTRMAGALVSSATVYLSQLNGIARAFNDKGTVEGFCAFLNERYNGKKSKLEDGTITTLYAYAGTINKKDGAGAPVKGWTEKLGKWLETNKPGDDASKDEVSAYTQAVLMHSALTKGLTPMADSALF